MSLEKGDSFIKVLYRVGDNISKSNSASPLKRFIYSILYYLIAGVFFLSIYWLASLLSGNSSSGLGSIFLIIFVIIVLLASGLESILSVIYQIAIFIQAIIHFKEGKVLSVLTFITTICYFGVAAVCLMILKSMQ